jgi:hypothetical protein
LVYSVQAEAGGIKAMKYVHINRSPTLKITLLHQNHGHYEVLEDSIEIYPKLGIDLLRSPSTKPAKVVTLAMPAKSQSQDTVRSETDLSQGKYQLLTV